MCININLYKKINYNLKFYLFSYRSVYYYRKEDYMYLYMLMRNYENINISFSLPASIHTDER